MNERQSYYHQIVGQEPLGLADVEITTTTRPRIIGADDKPINPPLWERVVAMALKTGWMQRKVKDWSTSAGAGLTAWLAANNLPYAAIVSGSVTVLLGIYSAVVSYICHHANVSAPPEFDPLQDTQEPIFYDPTPTMVNIPRMGLGETILPTKEEPEAKDVVPAGIWIAGIRDAGSKVEFRKPFGSLESAKAYVARANEIYTSKSEQAESTVYFPGEIMPMTPTYE